MNSPGIFSGIIIAFLISLAAGVAGLIFGGFIAPLTLFSLILYTATLAYLLYLLKHSSARVGRVVVISAWAAISIASWIFELALIEQVLIQAGIIWLLRSLYFHGSIFAAMLDFGLVSLGLGASAWAMLNTGSVGTAIWSFLLVQSLFSWIPQLSRNESGDAFGERPGQTSFQSAHRVAVDAVRKLSQP